MHVDILKTASYRPRLAENSLQRGLNVPNFLSGAISPVQELLKLIYICQIYRRNKSDSTFWPIRYCRRAWTMRLGPILYNWWEIQLTSNIKDSASEISRGFLVDFLRPSWPVSEMTYTVSSGTLNSSISYHWDHWRTQTSSRRASGRHDMPPLPASWQYLRIYSPGGTYSDTLAI